METKMVVNSAGGQSYAVDKWERLTRFLLLGNESGTYYVGKMELGKQVASSVLACLVENPNLVIFKVLDMDAKRRLVKLSPALWVLAQATAHPEPTIRGAAFGAATRICRYSTALFEFVDYMQQVRGWGKAAKRFVADWYNNKDVDDLAYQVLKYKQREGWSHRDLLRLSKPVPVDQAHSKLYSYVAGKFADYDKLPDMIACHDAIHKGLTETQYPGLRDAALGRLGFTWEMLPTEWLRDIRTWEKLAKYMPMGALLRNLGRMTQLGLTPELRQTLAVRIAGADAARQRVHPMQVLLATATYAKGHGLKSDSTWTPDLGILAALQTFFDSMLRGQAQIPGRISVCIDVSGSMYGSQVQSLTAIEAAGGMALSLLHAAPQAELLLIDTHLRQRYGVEKQPRTMAAMRKALTGLGGGGTNMSMCFVEADDPDVVIILTDSETWADTTRDRQALTHLRRNKRVKVVIVAMAPNGFTVADPDDPDVLQVVGFDPSVPQLIEAWIGGGGQTGGEEE